MQIVVVIVDGVTLVKAMRYTWQLTILQIIDKRVFYTGRTQPKGSHFFPVRIYHTEMEPCVWQCALSTQCIV